MKRIRRLPTAVRDLDQIWADIFVDNPAAADDLATLLIGATNRLRDYPESGTPKFGILPGLRSISVKRYRIYYRVSPEAVEIMRIVHQSRDESSLTFY
ncbi:type II toxin-antitoxin system RelE/ParE family toxin [Sphingomonas sp. ID1715]|uniref:type II toxin-antitoxin system RelE/ParE family toxin n=1 Tax=Sphingomonas sp. ID1715 TaxID=1656898 RepID=UPI001487B9B5|nr:type II toxin-antitoxin system RelE/ParE family toxin [Sphingomonas sp. ID1715]NNM78288.1 type II toxin-antitoxin system RelE/ParE family toxin [Sphingomonas sp. ID1715]